MATVISNNNRRTKIRFTFLILPNCRKTADRPSLQSTKSAHELRQNVFKGTLETVNSFRFGSVFTLNPANAIGAFAIRICLGWLRTRHRSHAVLTKFFRRRSGSTDCTALNRSQTPDYCTQNCVETNKDCPKAFLINPLLVFVRLCVKMGGSVGTVPFRLSEREGGACVGYRRFFCNGRPHQPFLTNRDSL